MNERSRNSLHQVGGTCSILLGLSYILLGGIHLLLPPEQRAAGSPMYFQSFAQNPTLLMLQYGVAALGALLAFAVVPAISKAVGWRNEGWLPWMSNLAYLGFATVAIDSARFLVYQPGRAEVFVAGDAAIQTSILVSEPLLYLDAGGLLGFGGVGFWVFTVSLLALRAGNLPKLLSYVGIAVAITYWLVMGGFVLNSGVLFTIGAALGGAILAPIWYIWIGLAVRNGAKDE